MPLDMRTFPRVLCICAALLLSRASVSQSAEIDPDEGLTTLKTATMRTWRIRLLPEFKNAADPKIRQQLDRVRFKVLRFSQFNAFANYSDNSIELPLGFVVMLNTICDAMTLTAHRPQLVEKLHAYVGHLAVQYVKYANATPSEQETFRFSEFPEFAGFPAAEAEALQQQPSYYNMKVAAIVDSLAVIVGHEIGHLVLRHKPSSDLSPRESRQQEYAADAFGIKLAMDSGFFVMLPLATTYTFFGLIEQNGRPGLGGSHPPAACRVSRMYDMALKQMDKLLDKQALNDDMKKFGGSREDFLLALGSFTQECERLQN